MGALTLSGRGLGDTFASPIDKLARAHPARVARTPASNDAPATAAGVARGVEGASGTGLSAEVATRYPRRMSDEQIRALHARHVAGASLRAISQESGMHRSLFVRRCSALGLSTRTHREAVSREHRNVARRETALGENDLSLARELHRRYVAGERLDELADSVGWTYKQLVYRVKRLNLPLDWTRRLSRSAPLARHGRFGAGYLWNETEIAALLDGFRRGGVEGACAAVPTRTRAACVVRLQTERERIRRQRADFVTRDPLLPEADQEPPYDPSLPKFDSRGFMERLAERPRMRRAS